MARSSFLSDLLQACKVRHTQWYTDAEFAKMPFHTLFGLTKLLKTYGIDSLGLELGDTSDALNLQTPYVAQTIKGFVIVTSASAETVSYISQGILETIAAEVFVKSLTGRVLLVETGHKSCEPAYEEHRLTATANRIKPWILAACCLILLVWGIIKAGLYAHWSTMAIVALDLAGIYITWLLVQKSAHIKSRHADAVCSVVEAGGCDDILATSASKFFGIFGWSEVGFAYFSVSLISLLIFPEHIAYLAAINLLCLPFSFWSVWYQRFKAHTWCTLCLCVQSMLWLLFACYLGGGWYKEIFPIKPEFFVLGISYLAVMLGINALMPMIDRSNPLTNDDNG